MRFIQAVFSELSQTSKHRKVLVSKPTTRFRVACDVQLRLNQPLDPSFHQLRRSWRSAVLIVISTSGTIWSGTRPVIAVPHTVQSKVAVGAEALWMLIAVTIRESLKESAGSGNVLLTGKITSIGAYRAK